HHLPKPFIACPKSPDYRMGNFDSRLITDGMNAMTNAELILNLKICLKQVPPGKVKDGNDEEFTTAPWPKAAWDHFQRAVQRDGQAFWDGKFWLRTPVDYAPLVAMVGKASYRCNVRCRLKLEVVPEELAHQIIQVAFLDTSKGAKDINNFRSHMALYCQKDINFRRLHKGAFSGRGSEVVFWVEWHRTILHELGHSLGLPHIGELLPGRNP